MFRNHIKIAYRNLLKNKSFSILNITGLSVGLCVTTLIALWINFELGFDGFHENEKNLYQVNNQYEVEGEIDTWNSTPKVMATVLKADYPEISRVSRYFFETPFLFTKNEKRIKATGTAVDADFLSMFRFPLIEGNVKTALSEVNTVVLTEKLAKTLFGEKDAIGQTLTIDNSELLTVSGVLKNLPDNTMFNFEYLLPWSYLEQKGWNDDNWSNNSIVTYVQLKDGTNFGAFSEKLASLRERYDRSSPDIHTFLYPFGRIHLHGKFENGREAGGRIDTIRLFGIIAGILLLIACINFMNLSTAQSEKRAREVGVRKVVGAKKGSLIAQFMGESIFIAIISAVIASGLVWTGLPYFNELVGRPLSLLTLPPAFWWGAAGTVVLTGILAGSYPAMYLSAFRPSAVLKGHFKKKSKNDVSPRSVLVIFQFGTAIILITATVIVQQQIKKAQTRNSGYSKNNLLYTHMEGDMEQHYTLIKDELLRSGAAISVTKTNAPIIESQSNTWGMLWDGKAQNDHTIVHRMMADEAIIRTMGLELKEGRDFDLLEYPSDSTAAIINESAALLMGFDDPIGKTINDRNRDWHVIGLVKDFVLDSPYQKIEPLVIQGADGWFDVINMKLNTDRSTRENLTMIEAILKKYNPEYPFQYQFVDRAYAQKFEDQQRIGKIASAFTLLTVLISCLGLFGLASYMAENRTKEIGIRKVLGATVGNITTLLTTQFMKLVAISFVIGAPISWYFMSNWLEGFAYRVTIAWWVFPLSGILAMGIAMVTISFQAIKAAVADPTNSLKTE